MVPKMKKGALVTEEELQQLRAAATAKALATGSDARQQSRNRQACAEAPEALRRMKDRLDSKELVATAPPGGQVTAVATPRPGSYTKGATVPKMKMGARVTEEELELLKAAATAKAFASGQDANKQQAQIRCRSGRRPAQEN